MKKKLKDIKDARNQQQLGVFSPTGICVIVQLISPLWSEEEEQELLMIKETEDKKRQDNKKGKVGQKHLDYLLWKNHHCEIEIVFCIWKVHV